LKKTKRKRAIAKSKAKPEIYVMVPSKGWMSGPTFARAHIRVKHGEYQYLEWREGKTIRSLYLGKKRKS
jgi:hypothetical protein